MKSPSLIRDIVGAMREALGPDGPPVTVKIRSGWDEGEPELPRGCRGGRRGGRAAVTFHARSRAQGYSGRAAWSLVAELASAGRARSSARATSAAEPTRRG